MALTIIKTFIGCNQIGLVFIAPFVLSPSESNILYAAGQKVYKTIDGGDNWTVTNRGNALTEGHPFLSLAVSPTNSNIVWGGTAPFVTDTDKPKLFYTRNGGRTWNEANNTKLPNRYPSDICVDPHDENSVYVTYSGYGTGHIFKSEDKGSTWLDITNNLPDLPGNAIIADPLFKDHLYFGNDMGVFVSTNGGADWEDYSQGLQDAVLVMDLKIANGVRKLFVGTHGNGAYKRGLIGQPSHLSDHSDEISINVFPNPAINQINFSFTEQYQGNKIDIRVFNIDGGLVHQKTIRDIQYIWNINKTVKGNVLYEIYVDDKFVKSGKVVIQQ